MKSFRKLSGILPLVLFIALFSGCGDEGNEDTYTASSVWFDIVSMEPSRKYHGSDADPLFGDVYDSRFGVTADYAEVVLLHHFKGDPMQVQTGFTTLHIYEYSVYYERTQHDQDLGGVEVPAPMERIPVSYTVPLEIEDDNEKKLNITIMSIQQKLEPPLSYLLDENGGTEPFTGLQTIQLNTFVTLYGKDGAGNEVVPKTAQLYIEYANYVND